jgi:hypothetical protein
MSETAFMRACPLAPSDASDAERNRPSWPDWRPDTVCHHWMTTVRVYGACGFGWPGDDEIRRCLRVGLPGIESIYSETRRS